MLPFVSIVIPMRNEAAHLGRCIDAILAQDYPANRFEVIVVDGESDDNSLDVLRAYGGRVRILHNPARIVPTAMNIGIRAAQGQIVARIDAHTVIEPDYIRIGVETLERSGADNVGGPMHAVGGGAFGDAVALAMSSRFGIGAYFHFASADRDVDTVYMGMYRRTAFEHVGLFDEELVRNQDDELNYRLRKHGGRIFLTTRMRSHYQNRQSLKMLARQFFQYGVWKVRVLQKHPRQMSVRHFVPPAFVAALVVTGLLAPVAWGARLLFATILGAYGMALTAAAATVAARQGWRRFPLVLSAFAVMHVGWGVGFLVGVVRFGHRWLIDEPSPPRLRAAAKEPLPASAGE
jgi:succinoglycan biosynthesis protein ExoA